MATPTINYTPSTNYNGNDSFEVQVSDAPTITGSPSTMANAPYNFIPTANNIDSDNLSFSIQHKPSWAAFSTATGTPTGNNTGRNFSNIIISVTANSQTTNLACLLLLLVKSQ